MIRRIDRVLVLAVFAVGAAQLLFTIAVDPHVKCEATTEIDAALAREGLAPQERCLTDATAYHLLARELAERGAYERPFDRTLLGLHRPTAEYPPLFPAVLAVSDRLGVNSIAAQQAVVGTLTAMATALAAGLLANSLGASSARAVAAALAVGMNPLMLQANALLMTEGTFAALTTFAVFGALQLARAPSALRAIALGALLGFAALTRGEGLVWTPIVAAAVMVAISRGSALPRRLGVAAVVVAVTAVVVVPWTIRNHARFGDLVPVSNNLGTVLDGANCDLTYRGPTVGAWRSTFVPGSTDRSTDCFEGFAIEDPSFSEADAAGRARRAGFDYATDHIGDWPSVGLARLGRTFGAFRPSQQVDLEVLEGRSHGWQRAGTVLWWATAPFAIGGLGALVVRRRARDAVVVAAPWIAVTLTTVVTYGSQRFRVGLDPTATVLALVALALLVRPSRAQVVASPAAA